MLADRPVRVGGHVGGNRHRGQILVKSELVAWSILKPVSLLELSVQARSISRWKPTVAAEV